MNRAASTPPSCAPSTTSNSESTAFPSRTTSSTPGDSTPLNPGFRPTMGNLACLLSPLVLSSNDFASTSMVVRDTRLVPAVISWRECTGGWPYAGSPTSRTSRLHSSSPVTARETISTVLGVCMPTAWTPARSRIPQAVPVWATRWSGGRTTGGNHGTSTPAPLRRS